MSVFAPTADWLFKRIVRICRGNPFRGGMVIGTAAPVASNLFLTAEHVISDTRDAAAIFLYGGPFNAPVPAHQFIRRTSKRKGRSDLDDYALIAIAPEHQIEEQFVMRVAVPDQAWTDWSALTLVGAGPPEESLTFQHDVHLRSLVPTSGALIAGAHVFQGTSGGPALVRDGSIVAIVQARKPNEGEVELLPARLFADFLREHSIAVTPIDLGQVHPNRSENLTDDFRRKCVTYRSRRVGSSVMNTKGELRWFKMGTNGTLPVKTMRSEALLLHIAPFDPFATGGQIQLQKIAKDPKLKECIDSWKPPLGMSAYRPWPLNYAGQPHGMIFFNGSSTNDYCGQYIRCDFNGMIEAADFTVCNGLQNRVLPGTQIEESVLGFVPNILRMLATLGANGPYFVGITLIGRFDYTTLDYFPSLADIPKETRRKELIGERDPFDLPEIVLEGPDDDLARAFRPSFDYMARSGGWMESPNFDDHGSWRVGNV
jgi:hypothetical protein